MTEIFTGTAISEALLARLSQDIQSLGRSPTCVTMYDPASPPALAYLARQQAMAAGINLTLRPMPWPADAPLTALQRLSAAPDVDAIACLFPLPKGLSPLAAAEAVGAAKDADAQHPWHLGRVLAEANDARLPATAIATALAAQGVMGELRGTTITVIGASTLIGRPLAMRLTDAGATVTLCHIDTPDLSRHTRSADLVIAATGVAGLLTRREIAEGGKVLDLGIVRQGAKLVGDADHDNLLGHASLLSHVPDGIGPITTACLFANVLAAATKSAPDYTF